MPRRSRSRPTIVNTLLNLGFWTLLTICVAAIVFSYLVDRTGNPPFRTYIVQSGSMEPAIMTGDIIVILPQPEYRVNDVITFRTPTERVVTHRILELSGADEQTTFVTKGDANRDIDTEIVPQSAVIGSVELVIPRLGFLVSFGKSFPGVILLVVLPASIIVVDELGNIIRALRRR